MAEACETDVKQDEAAPPLGQDVAEKGQTEQESVANKNDVADDQAPAQSEGQTSAVAA